MNSRYIRKEAIHFWSAQMDIQLRDVQSHLQVPVTLPSWATLATDCSEPFLSVQATTGCDRQPSEQLMDQTWASLRVIQDLIDQRTYVGVSASQVRHLEQQLTHLKDLIADRPSHPQFYQRQLVFDQSYLIQHLDPAQNDIDQVLAGAVLYTPLLAPETVKAIQVRLERHRYVINDI